MQHPAAGDDDVLAGLGGVFDLTFPPALFQQVRLYLPERHGKNCLQQAVRNMAGRLLLGIPIGFLGTAIPEADASIEIAHHDGVVRKVEQVCLVSQFFLCKDAGSHVLKRAHHADGLAFGEINRSIDHCPYPASIRPDHFCFQFPRLAIGFRFLNCCHDQRTGFSHIEAYILFQCRLVTRCEKVQPRRLIRPMDGASQQVDLPAADTCHATCPIKKLFAFAQRPLLPEALLLQLFSL